MTPKTPAPPPAPPSALDEQNRKLQEGVLTASLRKGYTSTILTDGLRTGLKSPARKPNVTGLG